VAANDSDLRTLPLRKTGQDADGFPQNFDA
jgi:hypothetical protein